MPVSTTTNQTAVVLATTSDVIPISFPFFDASDLVVIKTDADDGEDTTLTISTHYTVSGGSGSTGSVTMSGHASLAVGDTITVVRSVPYTQAVDLEEGDPLPSNTLERALDKLTVLVQQVSAKVARCFRVGSTSPAPDEATILDLSNKILGGNSSGDLVALTGAQATNLLNLPATVVDRPTKVFADAATRAAAVPDFTGQLGIQLDASNGDQVYISTATTAGSWTKYLSAIADGSIEAAKLASAVTVTALWADDAARALKVPGATGQLGLQLDTGILYRATGTSAGNWSAVLPADGALALGKLANVSGAGFLGKAGEGDAAPAHLTITGLTGATAAGTQEIMLQDGADLKKLSLANLALFIAGLPVVLVRDEKSDGTSAGTFTNGAWRQRDLNTEVIDTHNLASVGSNQVTLAAGTWLAIVRAPAFTVSDHRARLYNATDTAVVQLGSNTRSVQSASDSWILTSFTIAESKTFQVDHYCSSTVATTGFGRNDALTLGVEVYTEALFIRLSA